MIEVRLGGQVHAVPFNTNLAELVASLGHAPNAVTTAINASFVPRSARAQTILQPGDAVQLFKPIGGG